MRQISNKIRFAMALIALFVTTTRLIAPPAFAVPASCPAIKQLDAAGSSLGSVPKRLPRWPGKNRSR